MLNGPSTLQIFRGNQARAVELLEEYLSLSRKTGDLRGICVSISNLGVTAFLTGDYERAEALLQEAQEVAQQISNADMASVCDLMLGFRELREWSYLQDKDLALDILGGVAGARGEDGRAARIWGGVEGYREVTDIPWLQDDREMIEPHIEAARARLDEITWQKEWEKGCSMSLDQTVDYALENEERPKHGARRS